MVSTPPNPDSPVRCTARGVYTAKFRLPCTLHSVTPESKGITRVDCRFRGALVSGRFGVDPSALKVGGWVRGIKPRRPQAFYDTGWHLAALIVALLLLLVGASDVRSAPEAMCFLPFAKFTSQQCLQRS